MAFNVRNVVDHVLSKYQHLEPSTLKTEEERIASNIIDILEGHIAGNAEVFETLDVDECEF